MTDGWDWVMFRDGWGVRRRMMSWCVMGCCPGCLCNGVCMVVCTVYYDVLGEV